jgi:glycosyltransferase involved in cell wall biosynthesis
VKVLLDLRCLETPSARRGIGRYAAELTKALVASAPPGVRFAGLSFGGVAAPLGIEDVLCPGPRQGIGFTDRFVLPRLCARHGIDLYHSTAYAVPAFGGDGPATVLTVHDLVADVFPSALSRRHRMAFRRTFRSALTARRVIAVSESTRRDLLRRYEIAPERVVVVPNGVGAAFRATSAQAPSGWPAPFLLYVGGLDPLKNVPFLLAVLARARRDEAALKLVVIGEEGERRDAFAAAARAAGLADAVHLPGFVDDARLAAAYHEARAFVFPSRYEGFGLPPLEALAAGCPVVSSPAGSLAEVLEGVAILKAPDDPDAWAGALHELAVDAELRRKLIDAGRARAAGLSWEAAARRTLAVYAEAAREAAVA